jgi:hypothetical protein
LALTFNFVANSKSFPFLCVTKICLTKRVGREGCVGKKGENYLKMYITSTDITFARLFQTIPAKVAGKFEKNQPLQKIVCKATFQTHFVH